MKRFAIFASLFLAGCAESGKPLSVGKTENPDFRPEFLFQHEGVKVYRFADGGNTVYYTNVTGNTAQYHEVGDDESSHTESVISVNHKN